MADFIADELISVIVPVYKVEPYLRKCIDSIIAQTYRSLEIILVDDGSPDMCGSICDEYARIDPRIRVIHKRNGGLSDARNVGIDDSKGGLLTFVDSDDWIAGDMIELLYKNLISFEACISSCGCFSVFPNEVKSSWLSGEITTFSGVEAVYNAFDKDSKISVMAWGKLYRKHVFKGVRYPVGRLFEDMFVIGDVLYNSKCVVSELSAKYYYRQRKSGIARKSRSIVAQKDILDSYRHLKELASFFGFFDENKDFSLRVELNIICGEILMKNYTADDFKELLMKIKENSGYICGSDYFTPGEKIKVKALKKSIFLLRLLMIANNLKQKYLKSRKVNLFD